MGDYKRVHKYRLNDFIYYENRFSHKSVQESNLPDCHCVELTSKNEALKTRVVELEEEKLKKPRWIVNSIGELGVEVNGKQFFLYKGDNISYTGECDDEPMMYRSVGKREFGETCHPFKWWDSHGNANFPQGKYTEEVITGIKSKELPEEYKWKLLPNVNNKMEEKG